MKKIFKRTCLTVFLIFGIIPVSNQLVTAQQQELKTISDSTEIPANEKLVIVWTSGEREVALKMVFMYTYNTQRFNWWKDVTLIVWGPSTKLLSEDTELQEYIKKIMDAGIVVKACKACSDAYGVSDKIADLGITVKYVSEFTDYIKEGRHILTF
ncbi:MAG: DsrE family protein [Bacteroidales bacterium]|nr:DsrE family protein [Bacteroidales bacterium]